MKLAEIKHSEHTDPDDPIIVHLVNRLLDKGERVYYTAMHSNDPYEVTVDTCSSDGPNHEWVVIEYGIPSQRTGDVVSWEEAELEADKLTLVKHCNGEWWLQETT